MTGPSRPRFQDAGSARLPEMGVRSRDDGDDGPHFPRSQTGRPAARLAVASDDKAIVPEDVTGARSVTTVRGVGLRAGAGGSRS